jgi:hypothetical protein
MRYADRSNPGLAVNMAGTGIEAFVGTRAIFESCEGPLMSHESIDDSINI